MFKNYILITLRSMMRNKVFIFINVAGMGIAIALCMIAYLNWDFRDNWDNVQQNADKIYRIQFWHEALGDTERYGTSPLPLANHIRENFRDVKEVVRFVPSYSNIRIGDNLFNTSVVYADSMFFDMFTFRLKYGSAADFRRKSNIFISDELALKYFNREDVVGEQITQLNNNTLKEYTVAGVFEKLPLNSSFHFEAATNWDNLRESPGYRDMKEEDWSAFVTTFIQIDDPLHVAPVTRQLQQYVAPQNKAREDLKVREYYLENFRGIAGRSMAAPRLRENWLNVGAPDAVVVVPIIMAAMLLLLACFNFTNTSIALAGQRLKEIGIRKVMGSLRKQLIFQFMIENLLLCLLGFAAGLGFAEFLIPAYDSLWPWLELRLSYTENAGFIFFLAGLLLLTALIAGTYPSFYITSFNPISILKGRTRFGGTNWLTRIFLGLQFSISLVTIISAVGFYKNARYQQNYDLGFYTTGVITVWLKNQGDFNAYRDVLAQNKDILKIAGTKDDVATFTYPATVRYESNEKEVDMADVGDDYFQAMGMTLLAGREFRKDSDTDRRESVLVTEEFVKQFGWKDEPIGKRILWKDTVALYVIGVVKDVYTRSLFRPVTPMLIRYTAPENYRMLVAQVSPDKMTAVNEFMRKKWNELFPNGVYEGRFIDNEMKDTNDTNRNAVIIFGFIGFFAGLMSVTGLFALVSLHILKRTKEIGVRKVLGAPLPNIIRVICFEFILIIFLSSFLGGPMGFMILDFSMNAAWEYYEKASLSTLLLSVAILFILAILTIGTKTINTARMDPVKTLRDE